MLVNNMPLEMLSHKEIKCCFETLFVSFGQ
jgi:hypothetical protein